MRIFFLVFIFLSLSFSSSIRAVEAGTSGSLLCESSAGEYSFLSYDSRPDTIAHLESRGLPAGGHNWEAVVKAALELRGSRFLDQITFESDETSFYARASTRDAIEDVQNTVRELYISKDFYEKSIAHAIASLKVE
jgi:hypothetical protein